MRDGGAIEWNRLMKPQIFSWVVVLVSLAGGSAVAEERPECRERPGFGDPLRIEPIRSGRARALARFRLFVECDAGAEGEWTLDFENAARGVTRALGNIEGRGKPRPLGPSRRPFEADLYGKALYCTDLSPPPSTESVAGPPGARLTTYEAEVRARLTGTGALAALSRTYTARVDCPACQDRQPRGMIYVRISRRPLHRRGRGPGPHLEARLGAAWYACVRPSSTLKLRLFHGQSRRAALDALKPYAVIEGLERNLEVKERNAASRVPLDPAAICRRGSGWVAYELWGRGELHRASGGRGAVKIDCE